jgi:hypothetical protein
MSAVARMERSVIRDRDLIETAPDFAEPVIGRAFARPVGSSGLRLLPPVNLISSVVVFTRWIIPASQQVLDRCHGYCRRGNWASCAQ